MDLERFIVAHKRYFKIALKEIKNGYKESHWMWFIFPQLEFLGYSETAKYYGIKNKAEAIAFLNDEYLGTNLIEITENVLKLEDSMEYVFGEIDEKKLQSSMTLFYLVSGNEIFKEVLNRFYDGKLDEKTKRFIEKNN